MLKIIKRYQLLRGFQLSTSFLVNGKPISVTFQNGMHRPYLVKGRFSTNDPDLQAAIEADTSFGTQFYLEQIDAPEGYVPKVEGFKEAILDVVPDAVPSNQNEPGNAVDANQYEPGNATASELEKGEEVKTEEVIPAIPVITDYPEITNIQEARQKMFELFPGEFKPANMPNVKAVYNRAKAKNITFSKLV